MKQLLLIILTFLTLQEGLYAGSDSVKLDYIGMHTHYGFIIPHSRSIRDISDTNPYGFEVSYNRLHSSAEKFRVFNALWSSGLRLQYFNYQNPDILGEVISLSIYAEPVVLHKRNFIISVSGGTGLSYHTKVYDEIENPLNMFFSSRLAFPLYVDIRFKYKVADKYFISLSPSYNHISNGGIRKPNKGMNFPTLSLGIERFYQALPTYDKLHPKVSDQTKPSPFFILQALSSVKVIGGHGGAPEKTAFIYGLHARYSYPLGIIYSVNGGMEFIRDGYIKQSLLAEQRQADHKSLALTLGQDFLLGKMIFTQFLGIYLYSPFIPPDPVYQKYELAYRFNKHLSAGVFLKAHLHVAELMGVQVSWIF
jgi:hypothetical protein